MLVAQRAVSLMLYAQTHNCFLRYIHLANLLGFGHTPLVVALKNDCTLFLGLGPPLQKCKSADERYHSSWYVLCFVWYMYMFLDIPSSSRHFSNHPQGDILLKCSKNSLLVEEMELGTKSTHKVTGHILDTFGKCGDL